MLQLVRVLGESRDERFDVTSSVRSFLVTRGFREQPGDPRRSASVLSFRRSNQLATLLAFDPSRWRIDVEIDVRTRSVKMHAHTDGQVVTPRERRYFDAFFEELLTVMTPEAPPRALSIWGEQPLSRRAARAALNENVAVMFGFFLSLPALIILLHTAVAVPILWAICWGFIGSIAIAYACLFSVKNRKRSEPQDTQPQRY